MNFNPGFMEILLPCNKMKNLKLILHRKLPFYPLVVFFFFLEEGGGGGGKKFSNNFIIFGAQLAMSKKFELKTLAIYSKDPVSYFQMSYSIS